MLSYQIEIDFDKYGRKVIARCYGTAALVYDCASDAGLKISRRMSSSEMGGGGEDDVEENNPTPRRLDRSDGESNLPLQRLNPNLNPNPNWR